MQRSSRCPRAGAQLATRSRLPGFTALWRQMLQRCTRTSRRPLTRRLRPFSCTDLSTFLHRLTRCPRAGAQLATRSRLPGFTALWRQMLQRCTRTSRRPLTRRLRPFSCTHLSTFLHRLIHFSRTDSSTAFIAPGGRIGLTMPAARSEHPHCSPINEWPDPVRSNTGPGLTHGKGVSHAEG